MAQIESSSNLDRWPHPPCRLLTLILIRCGLRASDACTLVFDCMIHDGQGAPYLRYLNQEMRREARVPIDEELQAQIQTQQTQVARRWPEAHPHLLPAFERNAGGQRVLTYDSYPRILMRWLQICDIRDEHGDLVQLTPHQWRHASVQSMPVPEPNAHALDDVRPVEMQNRRDHPGKDEDEEPGDQAARDPADDDENPDADHRQQDGLRPSRCRFVAVPDPPDQFADLARVDPLGRVVGCHH